jgi:hypothetical protein
LRLRPAATSAGLFHRIIGGRVHIGAVFACGVDLLLALVDYIGGGTAQLFVGRSVGVVKCG